MSESDGKLSLINVGDWSKPANTLIEKISDAIGGITKPWQIKRVAEAQAIVDRIEVTAEIERAERLNRAALRFLAEEARKQENIESIISKALPDVREQAKPEQIEDDWIANFFDKCRLISDNEMQALWAKILSGEANSPGKYVKRTVNFLASIDKGDAILFSSLCRFNLSLNGALHPLIYDSDHPIYNDSGINFGTLSHLETIGLLHFGGSISDYTITFPSSSLILFSYFGEPVWVEFPNVFRVGKVMLTLVGQQLAPVCGADQIDGFVEYLRAWWKNLGYKVDPAVAAPP
jgi:hypothetical protein